MEEIAGEELTTYPSNSEFLDMVVYWLEKITGDQPS